jgi:hypothetical protein
MHPTWNPSCIWYQNRIVLFSSYQIVTVSCLSTFLMICNRLVWIHPLTFIYFDTTIWREYSLLLGVGPKARGVKTRGCKCPPLELTRVCRCLWESIYIIFVFNSLTHASYVVIFIFHSYPISVQGVFVNPAFIEPFGLTLIEVIFWILN